MKVSVRIYARAFAAGNSAAVQIKHSFSVYTYGFANSTRILTVSQRKFAANADDPSGVTFADAVPIQAEGDFVSRDSELIIQCNVTDKIIGAVIKNIDSLTN